MKQIGSWVATGAVCLVGFGGGCELGAVDESDEQLLSSDTSALTDENGIWRNGIWRNGVWWDGVDWNPVTTGGTQVASVAYHALTQAGLKASGWWGHLNTLGDNESRQDALELLRGVAKCALPEGTSLSVKTTIDFGLFKLPQYHSLPGSVGLAPQWQTPPMLTFTWWGQTHTLQLGPACDGTCQRWVTACFLSLLNPENHVPVSLRGDHPELAFTAGTASWAEGCDPSEPQPIGHAPCDPDLFEEFSTYTYMEASYWGNMFLPAPEIYVCKGDDTMAPQPVFDPEWIYDRVCGRGATDCALSEMGACGGVALCATDPADSLGGATHGWYDDCTDTLPGSYIPPGDPGPQSYSEVITIYLDPETAPSPGEI